MLPSVLLKVSFYLVPAISTVLDILKKKVKLEKIIIKIKLVKNV